MSKENQSVVVGIVLLVLFIDLFGFIAWTLSGQTPPDNFHAGIMSRSVYHLIVK